MLGYWYRYRNHYKNFPIAIWVNILAVFLITFGFMMSSLFTLFLNEKGINIQHIAMILAIGGVGSMLGSYLSGVLCRSISPNRLAQFSLLAFALAMASFPFFKSIHAFYILNFLANLSYGIFRPANNVVLFAHADPGDRTRVMALYRVSYNLGLAFATSIGGYLASINFNLFFLFTAATSVVGGVILLAFNKLLMSKTLTPKIDLTQKAHSARDFFSNRPYLLLCVLFFLFNLIFLQMRSTYGLYLEQFYQLNVREIGLLFMINFLLIVLLEVPLMSRLKSHDQISLLMWGSICVGLGLVILPFSNGGWGASLSVVLWSLGEILATSPFFVLALNYANPKAPEFYIGFFQSVMAFAVILAPIFGGFLYPFKQGYVLWLSCGMIALVMVYGFIILKRQGGPQAS